MAPMPTEWWLRPLSRAARVGEHRAVVGKRLRRMPAGGQRVRGGGPTGAAEGARGAEADVVEQDDEHVRGALRWAQARDRREGPGARLSAERAGAASGG